MHLFCQQAKYSAVADLEDSETLISSSSRTSSDSCRTKGLSAKGWTVCSLSASAILLLLLSTATGFAGYCLGRRFPSNFGATRHVSKYSPILEDVDIDYNTVQFNGTFVHENIYRQNASTEVDAAWESLGVGFRPLIVSESLAAKSGLTRDHVHIKEKYGGGYPVFVEGLHQLHCLNLLRKSLYYNYEHYHSKAEGAFSDSDRVQRWHVSHCLDFIRQRLMCSMDLGVFGSVWVDPENPDTFVDFNTKHVCRDFEAIRAWAEEHQMPEPESLPSDYFEVPVPGDGVRVWDVAP